MKEKEPYRFVIGMTIFGIGIIALMIFSVIEENTYKTIELADGTIEECKVVSDMGGTSLRDCKSGIDYMQVTDIKIKKTKQ